ncbi:hypothetical protein [Trabulsiella odontotermitis]|uniref:Uncharacterized protein n=1 Tax=Trabulsiella odontotermitis TaxID=379893 RepID=A0A0L0H280_9ENTR|nr:hypothetical protein [Trabulsiella odontotermitis]KNC94858.1 hypothetical protein GM31_09335 [Trabulsiella odontotermitis]
MKIFLADPKGKLTPSEAKSVIVEFSDGRKLKLTESETPTPKEIPEGISVWGIGKTAQSEYEKSTSIMNVIPVAANGIIIIPYHPYGTIQPAKKLSMEIFISDQDDTRRSVDTSNIVIELKSGKTLELLQDYAKRGLLIWGGREPVPGLPIEDAVKRTEGLGMSPKAANVIHVFPYKIQRDTPA